MPKILSLPNKPVRYINALMAKRAYTGKKYCSIPGYWAWCAAWQFILWGKNVDKIILEIKDQIYETIILCQEYLKNLNWSTVLLILALLFVFFLRKWELKKSFSFVLVILLLFILLVRIEAFLVFSLDIEGSNITVGIGRTIFLIIAAVVLIYHAVIKD